MLTPSPFTEMIEFKSISKSYGNITALRAVSFKVEKGEILGLLGVNGAGKTTIMKILACLTPPSAGCFSVGGIDGLQNPQGVRDQIGYMPEHNPLYLEMTVQGFLKFVAKVKNLGTLGLKDQIEQVIYQCNLEKVRKRIIQHLSKGYRQRVGIAQAIIGHPAVLILDEPTIGLDPSQVVEMRELIRAMAGKSTVLLSSHILSEVSQICGRVIIVHQGEILAEDSTHNLTKRLNQHRILNLEVRGSPEAVLGALQKIPGIILVKRIDGKRNYQAEIIHDEEVQASVPKILFSHNLDLLEMKINQMSLENIFLKIVDDNQEKRKR